MKKLYEYRRWPCAEKALRHIGIGNYFHARVMILFLPFNFLHREYVLSQLYLAKGIHQKATKKALICHRENQDPNLMSLYKSNLLGSPWIPKVLEAPEFHHYIVSCKGLNKYHFPRIDVKKVRLDLKKILELTRRRQIFGKLIDLKENTWNFENEKYIMSEENKNIPLNPIVGVNGMRLANVGEILSYMTFVESENPNYWNWFESLKQANNIRLTDLGSLMDVSLIVRYGNQLLKKPRVRILEIGGGYGRLTEALIRNLPVEIDQYLMVDAIPVSLVSAATYLNKNFPGKISFLEDGYFNDDSSQIVVIPSWAFAPNQLESFDLILNVESFQEMENEYVQYWLQVTDVLAKQGSYVYFSNSFDYVNIEPYSYPKNWQKIFSRNTARSWTENHPTTIMQVM